MEPVKYWFRLLLFNLIVLFINLVQCKWQDNLEPKYRTHFRNENKKPPPWGNFRSVHRHGDYLLVGAKNGLLNISLVNMNEVMVSSVPICLSIAQRLFT